MFLITQVVATIFALGRTVSISHIASRPTLYIATVCDNNISWSQAQKNGYDGPKLGPKEAEGQKREWTEEERRQASSSISLQMGTNQVASQKGMTPYGKQRQIYQS